MVIQAMTLPEDSVETFRVNWNLERFFYNTMEYDQNHRRSAYRELRKLGMIWVRNAIIAAHMHGRNYVTVSVDESFTKKHVQFLENFGFEVVDIVSVEWDSYEIRF